MSDCQNHLEELMDTNRIMNPIFIALFHISYIMISKMIKRLKPINISQPFPENRFSQSYI